MRELKFRAYDYINDKMVQCDGIDLINNLSIDASEGWDKAHEIAGHGYLMQFTGKYDINGVEIYEGDIIEFDRKVWGGDDNIHLVEWDDVNAEWSWAGGSTIDMEFRKVIGNIHQNPELLNEKY